MLSKTAAMSSMLPCQATQAKPFTTTRPRLPGLRGILAQKKSPLAARPRPMRDTTVRIGTPGGGGAPGAPGGPGGGGGVSPGPGTMPPGGGETPGGGVPGGETCIAATTSVLCLPFKPACCMLVLNLQCCVLCCSQWSAL